MKKESLFFGVGGLVVGLIIASLSIGQAVNHQNHMMMQVTGINASKLSNTSVQLARNQTTDANNISMTNMTNSLKNKSGNDFDKTFLAEMIVHHQGAINMAKLAVANAQHDEVKNLAVSILSTQTSEINQMKAWQLQWDYINSATQPDGMMEMTH